MKIILLSLLFILTIKDWESMKKSFYTPMASLNYVLALLDSRKAVNYPRAFEVLKAVLALQDQDPDSKTCGIWPYTLEEPLGKKDLSGYAGDLFQRWEFPIETCHSGRFDALF